MALVLRRTALFVFIVLIWALIAAAVAHASINVIASAQGSKATPSVHTATPAIVLR